jgi:hypothetical protein
LNDRALKLGEYAHYLEHGLTGRRGSIDSLLMHEQVNLEGSGASARPADMVGFVFVASRPRPRE